MKFIKVNNYQNIQKWTKLFNICWQEDSDDFWCKNIVKLYPKENEGCFLIKEKNKIVGIFSLYPLKKYLYFENFTILPELRNTGMGSGAMKQILLKYPNLVFDIPKPKNNNLDFNKTDLRRKKFYLKNKCNIYKKAIEFYPGGELNFIISTSVLTYNEIKKIIKLKNTWDDKIQFPLIQHMLPDVDVKLL